MSREAKRPRETTNADERRRNPRFPNSSLWSDDRREAHRDERDRTLEEVGLITDRTLPSSD